MPTTETHVIDCDADPFMPNSKWTVEEHKKGGQLAWDPTKLTLYLADEQRADGRIKANDLRKKLANKPVLNANVLDYLLTHLDLIPDDWKFNENGTTRLIYFWGTIYRTPDGGVPCVSFLNFEDGHWRRSHGWYGAVCGARCPAVLLAN